MSQAFLLWAREPVRKKDRYEKHNGLKAKKKN
jgi:hypothetical protein